MKTYKNLYPQICTFENLFLAFRAAARGKRGKAEVAAFERELEPNLFRLQEELTAQAYQPGPYTHFSISDPKPRIISAAPFRDRVVHHALVRVIEPIWANCYLNPLDQFIKRELKCQGYVRYVDDLLLFADDKPTLWRWKRESVDFLVGLRLRMHDQESTVYPVTNGIPFLGFRVYPDRRRLKRRNGVAFARRFRALRASLAAGEITQEQLYQSVQGWLAHAVHGDTEGLRRALVSAHPIPRSPS